VYLGIVAYVADDEEALRRDNSRQAVKEAGRAHAAGKGNDLSAGRHLSSPVPDP
jgi:hypothetical protein